MPQRGRGQPWSHNNQINQMMDQNFGQADEQCQSVAQSALQVLQTVAEITSSSRQITPQQRDELSINAFHLAQSLGLDDKGDIGRNQIWAMLTGQESQAYAGNKPGYRHPQQ